MYYSHMGNFPIHELPEKIRLLNGRTRTDILSYTDDDLAQAGYFIVPDPPNVTHLEKLGWNGSNWTIIDDSENRLREKWEEIREERNRRINDIEWKISRYFSRQRLQLNQIDSIENLDLYIQQLRDVTNQSDPFNIVWPEYNPL